MTRKRYCVIEATTLEEVLATCDRHIRNIGLTQADLLDNEDGTETDWFYINMFRETWADLRDDIEKMLAAQRSTSFELISQCIESGQVSAEQLSSHMQDPLFAAWYAKRRQIK